jgi:hypothetical protein
MGCAPVYKSQAQRDAGSIFAVSISLFERDVWVCLLRRVETRSSDWCEGTSTAARFRVPPFHSGRILTTFRYESLRYNATCSRVPTTLGWKCYLTMSNHISAGNAGIVGDISKTHGTSSYMHIQHAD